MQKLTKLLHSLRVPRSQYRGLPKNLTDAAVRGDVVAARLFIEAGEDIEQRTIGFQSPMHAACNFGHEEVAKLLNEHGAAMLPVKPRQAVTPIGDEGRVVDVARRRDIVSGALALIGVLDDPNEVDDELVPLLIRIVITAEPALVEAVLKKGADPDLRAHFGGLTALTEACALGLREIAEMLLAHGADIERADGNGRTPLMHAAVHGDPRLVEMLLQKGANKKIKDSNGITALKYAQGPYMERLRTLLK